MPVIICIDREKMADSIKHEHRGLRLTLVIIGFLVISIGLGFLFQSVFRHYRVPINLPLWEALSIICGIMLVLTVTIIPLPIAAVLLVVASLHWNPILVALAGSLGSSIGEFSSYFFGIIGKKVSINENTVGYRTVHGWILKYGVWAIAFLSFQPVIPFEIGGFIAGLAKMPVYKFFPAIWLGKFPKYLILIYFGDTVMHLFHFPHIY